MQGDLPLPLPKPRTKAFGNKQGNKGGRSSSVPLVVFKPSECRVQKCQAPLAVCRLPSPESPWDRVCVQVPKQSPPRPTTPPEKKMKRKLSVPLDCLDTSPKGVPKKQAPRSWVGDEPVKSTCACVRMKPSAINAAPLSLSLSLSLSCVADRIGPFKPGGRGEHSARSR